MSDDDTRRRLASVGPVERRSGLAKLVEAVVMPLFIIAAVIAGIGALASGHDRHEGLVISCGVVSAAVIPVFLFGVHRFIGIMDRWGRRPAITERRKLTIDAAWYGWGSTGTVVTDWARSKVRDNRLAVLASHRAIGIVDLCPEQRKQLHIDYSLDGVPMGRHITDEDKLAELPPR